MNKVLIASFDMEIGGVEKSLLSMLDNFDYKSYKIDLMLYSHTGDLMTQLPPQTKLLAEVNAYRTFRMSIRQIFKKGHILIGLTRLLAKLQASLGQSSEKGYKQMQYMWKYAIPFLPRLETNYDVAISYLWPHYFIAEKVKAKTKVAWIHTDYSKVETNKKMDVAMWEKFDYLIAVSSECKCAFVKTYSMLADKVIVIENITSPELVRKEATEKIENPLIKDELFKIVTVARLSHAKGIDQAVKALKLLKERGLENIVWYVIGYGGDESIIRHLITK